MKKLYVATAGLFISGCLSLADWPHENFKQNYGGQVGKRADDPSSLISRYPQLIAARRELQNGNVEIEFLHMKSNIRVAECVVFYEIDQATNMIVGWRFNGNEKVCSWTP